MEQHSDLQTQIIATDRQNVTSILATYSEKLPPPPSSPPSPPSYASPVFAVGVLGAFVAGFLLLGFWYWLCLSNKNKQTEATDGASSSSVTASSAGIALEEAKGSTTTSKAAEESPWELNDAARAAKALEEQAEA